MKGGARAMAKVAAASAEQDIVARLQQAENELESLRRELDHTHQLATLGTLTAGIAHEINNILTPVLAYAQLARSNPHDTNLRAKALERAIAGVESAARITEAVLGFARTDLGDDHANILEVIEASLACLARDPARDGINVLVQVAPDALVTIRPLALQQVLLNLTLNALNALKGKPGELRITAQHTDETTRITVADSGPGIPDDVAATLFQPFVSGHAGNGKTATGQGGSGLGLAICKRLIEDSGGTIALDDPAAGPGGACFTIVLPTFCQDQDQS